MRSGKIGLSKHTLMPASQDRVYTARLLAKSVCPEDVEQL